MAKTLRVKRNIKKNISRYNKYEFDTMSATAVFFSRLFAVFLAILLPLITVSVGANIAFRVPDIYSFDLARTGAIQEIALESEPAEIGALISDYMLHKTERFHLNADFKGVHTGVFTITDAIMMMRAREVLDKVLFALVFMVPICIVAFIVLIRSGRWKLLRSSIKAAFIFYGICLLGFGSYLYFEEVRKYFFTVFLQVTFTDIDVLPQLLGGYAIEALAVVVVFSAIIMFIAKSVGWNLTREKKLFD